MGKWALLGIITSFVFQFVPYQILSCALILNLNFAFNFLREKKPRSILVLKSCIRNLILNIESIKMNRLKSRLANPSWAYKNQTYYQWNIYWQLSLKYFKFDSCVVVLFSFVLWVNKSIDKSCRLEPNQSYMAEMISVDLRFYYL